MDYSLINNKKILITGSNSRFAKALRKTFKGKNIIYTDRKQLNILNLNSIDKCLDKNKPTHLIHLASLSRPMIVHEKDISSSIDANIIGTANMVKKCAERNIKIIFFSTNYIYPGIKGNYKEEDALKPINNYAWSKLGGESSVKLYKNSLVLRLAMTEYPFIHDKAFTDAKINFIYREEVIKMLPYLLDEIGIINIGSDITESVFSFAKKTKKDVAPISVKNIKDFPKNSSVNIEKLKEILKRKKQNITDRKNIKQLKKSFSDTKILNRLSISQLEREIVDDMMRFGWNDFGYLKKFEGEFSKYNKKKYCLLLPSFKMVIHIVMSLMKISNKRKVVVTDFCDKIILECLKELDIKKKSVGVNDDNLSININSLKEKLNNKTKIFIHGDFFGDITYLEEARKICRKKNILFIENISNSIGSKYKNSQSGGFGDIAVCNFSRENMITCGEGGALLTNNRSFFINAKKMRDGVKFPTRHLKNTNLYFKPTNLQAAMIFGQFKRINDLIINKKRILNKYRSNFSNLDVKFFGTNLIFIKFNKNYKININLLINFLRKNNIYTSKILPSKDENFKSIDRSLLILPCNYDLKDDEINYVSDKIKFFLKKNKLN